MKKGYPLKGTRIAVLGVAYKRNVDDPRESPFFALRDFLESKGAQLNIFDNWVNKENTVDSVEAAVSNAKALIIVTEHSDLIVALNKIDLAKTEIEVVVDGRNCLDGDLIKTMGISYRGIGRRA